MFGIAVAELWLCLGDAVVAVSGVALFGGSLQLLVLAIVDTRRVVRWPVEQQSETPRERQGRLARSVDRHTVVDLMVNLVPIGIMRCSPRCSSSPRRGRFGPASLLQFGLLLRPSAEVGYAADGGVTTAALLGAGILLREAASRRADMEPSGSD
ncbi:MAG: hypothetical protein V5A38_06145 [Halolamina sp.]|uniref:hypothetical protein n=1 Tax=Halolamina sp. TaxID=1940283 RepID=UPI002FC2AB4A